MKDDTWHQYFARLRDESPVHYQADSPFGPFWSITRFEDMAEMQLRILWEEIMARFSRVEVVGELTGVHSNFVRGYDSLPVRVHPL